MKRSFFLMVLTVFLGIQLVIVPGCGKNKETDSSANVDSELLASVKQFLSTHRDYGSLVECENTEPWSEGKSVRVSTDKSDYSFNFKNGKVAVVYRINDDKNKVKVYNISEKKSDQKKTSASTDPSPTPKVNLKDLTCKYNNYVGSYNESGNYYNVTYGIEIFNPNEVYAAKPVYLTVRLFDRNENKLAGKNHVISYIPPESTAYFGASLNAKKKDVKIKVEISDITKWDDRGDKIPDFIFENLQYVFNEETKSGGKITGSIKNPYDEKVTNCMVTYVVLDSDEKILGGGNVFIKDIPASGSKNFSTEMQGISKVVGIKASATVQGAMEPYIE